jgi:hypothetical protein
MVPIRVDMTSSGRAKAAVRKFPESESEKLTSESRLQIFFLDFI